MAFAPNVSAHFNDGAYDFASFKAYFAAVRANLAAKYDTFEHGFETVVGAAAADGSTGGFGIVTGWEGGLVQGVRYYGTDGAFAVVREFEGELKITEVSMRVLGVVVLRFASDGRSCPSARPATGPSATIGCALRCLDHDITRRVRSRSRSRALGVGLGIGHALTST